jgi:ubiquinone/menaquinone biosynthesis C-methylase UbiE
MAQALDIKKDIQAFWDSRPCDAERSAHPVGSREFFEDVRRWRYSYEHHIPAFADFPSAAGKAVLEIGLGVGVDHVEFARHGARMHGIDLSPQAVQITGRHLEVCGLRSELQVADAEAIPYPADHFDVVYSYGVLLCIPNIAQAVAEIHRVLKPGGVARIMLYYKHSYNYWVNIQVLRRLGLNLLRLPNGPQLASRLSGQPIEVMNRYKQIFAEAKRPDGQFFLNQNTDGPGNPYTSVYTKAECRRLFGSFRKLRQRVYFLNKTYIPLVGKLIPKGLENAASRAIGWHLCISAWK